MIERSALRSIGRVRVNHALEHACITILSGRVNNVVLRGRSNRHGFYVWGDVPTEAVESAAAEALQRLSNGEAELAIHPFCGTNLAVSGLLAGTASAIALKSARKGEGLPASILAALLALLAAQPIGFWTQRTLTTSSRVGHARIVSVKRKRLLGQTLHFVSTSQ